MQLKTFRARSMAQALAEVKKDLGRDAVILHTRAYRVGAVMGMGGHDEYEITAADRLPPTNGDRSPPDRAPSQRGLTRTVLPDDAGLVTLPGPGAYAKSALGRAPFDASPALGDANATNPAIAGTGEFSVRGPSIKSNRAATDPATATSPSQAGGRSHALTTPVALRPTGAEEFVPSSYTSLGIAAPIAQALESTQRQSSQQGSERSGSGRKDAIAGPGARPASARNPDPAHAPLAGDQEVEQAPAPGNAPAVAAPERPNSAASLAIPATFAPTDEQTLGQLKDELGSIRRLVGQLLSETRRVGGVSVPGAMAFPTSPLAHVGLSEPLLEHTLRLQDAGVRPEHIDRVIGGVRDELSPDELGDAQVVGVCVQRHLAAMLPVVGSVTRVGHRTTPTAGKTTPPPTRPLVIALIGPTGVGKTTTIAKLAASYALRHGAKVGLVTCDTYRIAAVDQLRTYAGIMDMPMKVALTPREGVEAVESLSDCGVVLIDSAGRSPQDSVRLEEMGAFLEALAPEETHLVLNVGSSEDALTHAAVRFGLLQPTHLLLTKLDEAVRYGVLVNLSQAIGIKISYVTTGQEVPAQIELANADRLARLVLEGKLWRTA